MRVKSDPVVSVQAFCNRRLGEDQFVAFQEFLERKVHGCENAQQEMLMECRQNTPHPTSR